MTNTQTSSGRNSILGVGMIIENQSLKVRFRNHLFIVEVFESEKWCEYRFWYFENIFYNSRFYEILKKVPKDQSNMNSIIFSTLKVAHWKNLWFLTLHCHSYSTLFGSPSDYICLATIKIIRSIFISLCTFKMMLLSNLVSPQAYLIGGWSCNILALVTNMTFIVV